MGKILLQDGKDEGSKTIQIIASRSLIDERFEIDGKSVTWYSAGIIHKSFTVSGEILQIGWCSFSHVDTSSQLWILHKDGVMIHSEQGKLLEIPLPCTIQRMWAIPGGLLLERDQSQITTKDKEFSRSPNLFSMLNPLEEIKPVSFLSKNSGISKVSIPSDLIQNDPTTIFDEPDFVSKQDQVVFVSDRLPLMITHSADTQTHHFWILHKKDDPNEERTYERAQHLAQLRVEQEDEKRKARLLHSLQNSNLDSSFHYEEQHSIIEESFLVESDALIKGEIYLEWIFSESPSHCSPEPASRSFLTFSRDGKILIALFCQKQGLKVFKVHYETRYTITTEFSLDNIQQAIPIIFSSPHPIAEQNIPGLVRSRTNSDIYLSDIFVLQTNGNLAIYNSNSLLGQVEIGQQLLDRYQWDLASNPIVALLDFVGNRFSVLTHNGSRYRFSLPILGESKLLVDCLRSFTNILSLDISNSFVFDLVSHHWNSSHRNSEWESFTQVFYELLLRTHPNHSQTSSEQIQTSQELSDWEYLLQSSFHLTQRQHSPLLHNLLPSHEIQIPPNANGFLHVKGNYQTQIFQWISNLDRIHTGLHLLFESYKLNTLVWNHISDLGQILFVLSIVLQRKDFQEYYQRHIGNQISLPPEYQELLSWNHWSNVHENLPVAPLVNVFEWMENMINANLSYEESHPIQLQEPRPVAPTDGLRALCRIYHLLGGGDGKKFERLSHNIPKTYSEVFTGSLCPHTLALLTNGGKFSILQAELTQKCSTEAHLVDNGKNINERVVLCMVEEHLDSSVFDSLPYGIGLALREAIFHCRHNPPSDWDFVSYQLIGRDDLAMQSKLIANPERYKTSPPPIIIPKDSLDDPVAFQRLVDGIEFNDPVARLRFSKDLRWHEIQRVCRSSYTQWIKVNIETGTSDQELVSIQQQYLQKLALRTMSTPFTRAMFCLSSASLLATETIPIPLLELNGKIKETKVLLHLAAPDGSPLPSDFDCWAQFHNGVAVGLRIAPNQSQMSNAWIVFNKPKTPSNSHAGFLLGLGLQGHLSVLELPKVFEYLKENHSSTSIGLLLGLSLTKRGTMDSNVTRLLSIHIPALHPPASADLEVSPSVQIAALMGVGLIFQRTNHRGMIEMLIDQIGVPPSDDKNFDRESYSLVAGLSLGFISLGKGGNSPGLSDLHIEDRLIRYIHGGQQQAVYQTSRKSDSSSKAINVNSSSLVLEGHSINTDVSAAGATLAFGLLYLQTNDHDAASRLDVPDTTFLLEYVRPDLLLLRVLCRSLIMWDEIFPSQEWIERQIPRVVLQIAKPNATQQMSLHDWDTLQTAYLELLTGCCLAIGMRYAGSSSSLALELLVEKVKYIQKLKSINAKQAQPLNKFTLERCLCVIVLSVSLVMAGSGNLKCFKLFRSLRSRVMEAELSYGSHLAISMSIGFLFLAGGRYSLNTDALSIAYLLCAIYPQFPFSQNDNRYHLQALRHFYVLACSPRCIEIRDVDSFEACFVPLEVTLKETKLFAETKLQVTAPCILPEWHLIKSIRVSTPRYWESNFDFINQPHVIQSFKRAGVLFVKRKPGFLSYMDDPKGFRSILSRSFPKIFLETPSSQIGSSLSRTHFVQAFSSDPNILAFVQHFCSSVDSLGLLQSNPRALEFNSFCTSVLYECLSNGSPEMLSVYMELLSTVDRLAFGYPSLAVWNLKLLFSTLR